VTTIGVNAYLWRASLETLSFMPLVQTDSNGGVIVTDWYANPNAAGERMKVTVTILDQDLRADALRVAASRQVSQNGQWVDAGAGRDRAEAGRHHPHQGPRPAPQRDRRYVLEMFPYPSGRIHMGHVRNYTMGDVLARYKRMQGLKCCIRWAGTPSACRPKTPRWKRGPSRRLDPRQHRQHEGAAEAPGLALDWSRELATCEPEYYGQQQALFLDLYGGGPRLPQGKRGQLGPGRHDRAGQRAGDRRRGWRSGALVESAS
jgi:hypothetical protein